jgi:endonuclease/exonuclease/phosphatase (EEP) superfamily protein YafD
MHRSLSLLRRCLALAAPLALAACMSLPLEPRALTDAPGGVRMISFDCGTALATARAAPADQGKALDPGAIRVLTWNIHKQEDDGWEADLTRFAASSDILLLQEVALEDALQAILRGAGLRFVMGSSFVYNDAEFGVLTATRAAPVAACTQRIEEPLIRIPKSAVIVWLPLPGRRHTLAVANLHSINFSLSLAAYEAQLAALADVLAQHEGPILLGGDLNTWSQARLDAVARTARRLNLVEIPYAEDGRTLFLGNQVDHLLVRGLAVTTSRTTAVTSSDHNPAGAVLRLAPVLP